MDEPGRTLRVNPGHRFNDLVYDQFRTEIVRRCIGQSHKPIASEMSFYRRITSTRGISAHVFGPESVSKAAIEWIVGPCRSRLRTGYPPQSTLQLPWMKGAASGQAHTPGHDPGRACSPGS